MAIKFVKVGAAGNDGTGDLIRVGGQKINNNFSEIYSTFGNGTTLTPAESKATALASNNALKVLINDRIQVANSKTIGISGAVFTNANDTIIFNRPDGSNFPVTLSGFGTGTGNVSNTYLEATFVKKATALSSNNGLKTYTNIAVGSTNTAIRTVINTTIGSTNTALRSLIGTKLNTTTFNAGIGSTNTALRALINDKINSTTVNQNFFKRNLAGTVAITANTNQTGANASFTSFINVSGSSGGLAVSSQSNGNPIAHYYPTLQSLRAVSAANFHGAIGHVHSNGKLYYAHAGAWKALAGVDTAAANTYVNAQVGSTNTALRTLISARLATTIFNAQIGSTNTALRALVSNEIINRNVSIGQTNTALRALDTTKGVYTNSNTTITFTKSGGATYPTQIGPSTVSQFDVTNNASNGYRFSPYDYENNGDNPNIFAISGTTIAFNLNVSGHPFAIKDQAGTNYSNGLIHISTTGVKSVNAAAQGQVTGTLYWRIPQNLGGNFRYQCTSHSGMRGNVVIKQIASI